MAQLHSHRSKLAILLVFILLGAFLAGPTMPAAAQGNVTLNVDRMESGSGDAMTAYVSVRDENGVPVSGLMAQNFTIVEDMGTAFPPGSIAVQVNPQARLSVALAIDLSGTMRDQAMADAKAASQKLLETLLSEGNDADRAAFFGINGPVNIDDLTIHDEQFEIGFTNDRNKILNLVNTLEGKANVATPLYDALFRIAKITSLQSGPRAIIVLTDGQDPRVSKLAADDPISAANRNNIPIFPIGFSRGVINDSYLTRLAANTGGAYLKAAQASEISGLFQETLGKLSEQYVLKYNTTLPRNDQPHAVIVRVETAKGKGSDDAIFQFKDVPTAAPAVAPAADAVKSAPTGVTESTEGAAGTAPALVSGEPAPPIEEKFPQNVVTKVKDFVGNKDNLPILIGIVAALVLLLALIVFLLVRRSRAARNVPSEYEYGNGYAPIGVGMSEGPTAENPVGVESTSGATLAGDVATAYGTPQGVAPGYPPTQYDPQSAATGGAPGYAPYPGTQGPGVGSGNPPYSPTPGPGAVSGGTVILSRKPQQQVVAILVNRKKPQERFDVVPSTNVGRATENQVVLQDGTVSRQHAKIKLEKGEFKIFDLASANHTYVNEVQVLDPVPLKDGDVVKFGEVEFLFKRLA